MSLSIAFDRVNQILAVYNVASDERRFKSLPGGNPMKEVKAPPKPKPKTTWEPYTEEESADILIAARSAAPEIKWTHWLSSALGTIVSEIADRKVSDFKVMDGIDYLDIPEGKTDCRPRKIPLASFCGGKGYSIISI